MASSPKQPDIRQEVSPYGPLAAQLGLAAVHAVDDLADEPEWRGGTQRRWHPSDHRSFNSILKFAHLAGEAQGRMNLFSAGLAPEDWDGVSYGYNLNAFHTALPFSEAERHWLIFTTHIDARGVSEERPADQVWMRSTTDYDAGCSREIRGRDLLDTWWAWRRDIFEFQQQGGIDYALAGLRGIAQILVPDIPQVATYKPMRGADLKETRRWRKIEREAGATTGTRRQQAAASR